MLCSDEVVIEEPSLFLSEHENPPGTVGEAFVHWCKGNVPDHRRKGIEPGFASAAGVVPNGMAVAGAAKLINLSGCYDHDPRAGRVIAPLALCAQRAGHSLDGTGRRPEVARGGQPRVFRARLRGWRRRPTSRERELPLTRPA